MAIKIEMLRCFATVAETGNLSEAATRLGRTQSAISMTLKQLEEHLGQRLFESERKNRLSALGLRVFELAQQQLRQFDDTISAIEASARSPQGLLRIASVPSAAGLLLPPAIEVLMQRHPGLKIEIRDADTRTVLDALVGGKADLAIVSGLHALNGIRTQLLFDDPFGLICGPDHPLALRTAPVRLHDVLASDFIGNELCRQIKQDSIQRALSEAHLTVHNTLSLIGMLRTGKRVTILPKTVHEMLPGQLVFKEIPDLRVPRPVVVLVAERSPQRAFADEFATIIRALTQQMRAAEEA